MNKLFKMLSGSFKGVVLIAFFIISPLLSSFFSDKAFAQSTTVTLRPIGNGAVNQWIPFLCYPNWQCVSGSTLDSAYVFTAASNQTDLYDLDDLIPSGSTINNVVIKATAVGGGFFYIVIRTNGQTSVGSPILMTGQNWTVHSRELSTNPVTGSAWTASQIDNLEIGVATSFISAPFVNQVWAQVTYTPPEPTSTPTPQPTGEDIGFCGDGICQDIACRAYNCPIPENESNCPQDCSPTTTPPPTPPPSDDGIFCIPLVPGFCPAGFVCGANWRCKPEQPPSPTPTPTSILSPTSIQTPTPIISPTSTCQLKPQGDANCDGRVNTDDFNIWRDEFLGVLSSKSSDFNNDSIVNTDDFNIWRDGFLNESIPH